MKIGLFFGSFNPVHHGHLIIANLIANDTEIDQVWMVVSPQNPFKVQQDLAEERHRLQMLRLATRGNKKIKASNVEFSMPRPSYTIDTLNLLKRKYPGNNFALIIGEDNLAKFNKWKQFDQILAGHQILVYRRDGSSPHQYGSHPSFRFLDFPTINLSASYIRDRISEGHSVQYLVPTSVLNYLKKHRIFRS